jgi:GAF domain-containing protein
MTIQSDQPAAFAPEDIAALQSMADQIANALENARLFEESQRHAAREQLIGEVTTQIRSTLDLETVIEMALNEIHRAMGLDQVSIHLATREDGTASPDQGRE